MVSEVRRSVKYLRKACKLPHAEIETERVIFYQKSWKSAQRVEQAQKGKEKMTDKIQIYGLWQSEEEADSALIRTDLY